MARIIDVIEAPDQGPADMVVRIPQSGSGDFQIGSQVIVRESQTAVFFRDGKALDSFGAGRHTITTANIPLITNLLERIFSSGKNIFTAEVYFVNRREFLEQKWGTPEPITLRDKDLGMVRLRAFGNYSMQVSDPQLFVTKIVGTQGLYQTAQIDAYLRGVIISRMTDVLASSGASFLDMPALFDELSAGIKARLADDFAALGIALKQMFIQSVSPTEETQKAIDERASMGAIGNMQAYMQYKAARALGDAAQAGDGGAGSLTGAGLGLGAGMGLGGVMAQAMTQAMAAGQQQPGAAPAAAAAVPDVMTTAEAAAYLKVSEADVLALIAEGDLKARKIGAQYRVGRAALDEFLKG
ncbi:SPFH domain-containing protein [Candidatus Amarolinea dominans]|uniref:SPFH domain-containing protein n=1 Tax=Candidatus Amarolinea dominans TaxID=3140696 RepID=UPI003136C509|nr:SPFH domain-containing protein [Anaerolineae bacterium]MBK9233662.1 SPFH domain-containing protein [Anaerolineae bacterium]